MDTVVQRVYYTLCYDIRLNIRYTEVPAVVIWCYIIKNELNSIVLSHWLTVFVSHSFTEESQHLDDADLQEKLDYICVDLS